MNFRNELINFPAKSNAMVKDTAFLGVLLSDHLKPDFSPLIIKSKDRLYHEIKEVCGLQKITEEHLSQVFISIALILGDGLYNFIKVLSFTIRSFHGRLKRKDPQNRLLIIIGVILLVSSSCLVAVLPRPLRPFYTRAKRGISASSPPV
ncbi:iron-phytosiderophore transporter yellow stripe 1-like isoform X1 [Magnolia sinica]|uniref:iron-phytosiderophore transporter yellow stripe 1-like isoform X1 n=1 Tax=Magnolia sinica TaxID=86752 RepID=UPI00265A6D5D|nr:iron-phytosiderophore transporter yellow stripe 1-like isoform X1 [Magnolia sinica]